MSTTTHMLSTIDNPYNPFTQYDAWYAYDTQAGHHSAAFLARITHSSDDLSDEDQKLSIEQAIDEIVRENVTGMFIKVPEPSDTSTQS